MIDLNLFWKIVPLIFSATALLISIRVFSLFYRREIQKKQLELILDLIEKFQKCDISVSLANYSEKSKFYAHFDKGNLFHIAKTRNNRNPTLMENERTFNCPVYMTEETITRIGITDFIRNPMLPNKIAKSLRKAFPKNITYSERGNSDYNLIQIDEYRILDAKKAKEFKNQAFSNYVSNLGINYGDFLIHINDTSSEVNKFLRKVGVKNLNIEWNK